MIKNAIPFFGNTQDDTHCFQAILKMLIKHYFPQEDYSWEELEKISAKVEGLWTWPIAGLLWLGNKGVKVQVIEEFDYDRFIEKGGEYLIEKNGEEVGKAQIAHSNIAQEVDYAKTFVKVASVEQKIPGIGDIKKLLDEGRLIVCNVNSSALNNRPGYVGHFVLVYDYKGDSLIFHDPGLPPLRARSVSTEHFIKAWAYPNDTAKNIMAFRK